MCNRLVKLHNAVTFQMLHRVIPFDIVTSCRNIVLLYVTCYVRM